MYKKLKRILSMMLLGGFFKLCVNLLSGVE